MEFVVLVLRGISWLVLIDAVLSWFVHPDAFPRSLTRQLTAPLYAPIRAILKPQSTGIDFSPLILMLGFQLLANALFKAYLAG